jgi:hypothetical protein
MTEKELVIARNPLTLSLRGTLSLCHCEEPSHSVIARSGATKQSHEKGIATSFDKLRTRDDTRH